MNLKEQVLSGLRWSVGAKFLSQVITWAVTVIVMRLVTPSDYGLMSMSSVFLTYMASLTEFGFGSVLIQNRDLDILTVRKVFFFLILVGGISCLIIFMLAPLIGSFLKEERIIPIIQLMSIQLVLTCFSIIPQAFLDRDMLFERRSLIDLFSTVAGSATSFVLAILDHGVWALVWGSLVIVICKTGFLNLLSPFFHPPSPSLRGMGQVFSFGGYVTTTRILWLLYSQADVMIIGRTLGKELLGLYSVALTIASLPMEKVSGIVNQVAFPAFAQSQDDPKKAAMYYLKSVRVMSFLAFPILWGISCTSEELVRILLGEKWLMSVLPIQLLSLVIPFRMIGNLCSPAVTGIGRPDISFSYALLCALLIPIGILVGIRWGLLGACLAWVVLYPPLLLFYLFKTTKAFGLQVLDVVYAMARPVFAASVMYVAVMSAKLLFTLEHHMMLVLLVFTGAVVYGIAVLLFARQLFKEALGLVTFGTK